MTIDEEQVRTALRRQAERVEPADGSLTRIQAGAAAARRRRLRSGGLTGLATAATVALVFATVSLVPDDTAPVVETGPAGPSLPTEPLELSRPPEPPRPPGVSPPVENRAPLILPGIWPLHTVAEREAYLAAGETRYDDPVEVARAFAVGSSPWWIPSWASHQAQG